MSEAAEPEFPACEMTHTPPFDFAQCEQHDTTFPLGTVCKFHERDPFDVLYEEVDEKRTCAVRAEMERDAARAALERVRGLVEDGDRLDGLWIYAPDLERALEGES